MKLFVFKSVIVALLLTLIHFFTALFFAGGKTDIHYRRFTSPSQTSLILGISNGGICIVPEVINNSLSEEEYQLPIYNYAFTIGTSRYGPLYYEAIRKKVKKNTQNGLFILQVSPWTISKSISNSADDQNKFVENSRFFKTVKHINMILPVNIEYLVKNYSKGWGNLIVDYFKQSVYYLHRDGWLEVKPENSALTKEEIVQKEYEKYYKHSKSEEFSLLRYTYLVETIEFLKTKGNVVLVRVPKPKKMRQLCDSYMPDFDSKMEKISIEWNVKYLDLYEDNYIYDSYDGNHLSKGEAFRFTKKLTEYLK